MKKITALVLLFSLALGLCCALGEANVKTELGSINLNGAFKLQCSVPENYQIKIASKDNEGLIALIESEDAAKPRMYLSIEFDETYYDVKRMNDMTEEQLQAIVDTFTNDGEEVAVSYRETAHGTKLMMVQDTLDDTSFVAFITVYEGYMVEFDIVPGSEMQGGLTEEQIQLSIDFLSDLDFIPEEA